MVVDITEHPDAPGPEELQEVTVEPVPRGRIENRRAGGFVLVEDNLREREDLDVEVTLNRQVRGHDHEQDIGMYLYRYTQLFGAPQCPEYHAGEDISDRTDTTFKYLLRVRGGGVEDLPEEWLVTVFDWHVDLGVGVAEWRDEHADFEADRGTALASLQLAHNIGSEPVRCEYEDIWY